MALRTAVLLLVHAALASPGASREATPRIVNGAAASPLARTQSTKSVGNKADQQAGLEQQAAGESAKFVSESV